MPFEVIHYFYVYSYFFFITQGKSQAYGGVQTNSRKRCNPRIDLLSEYANGAVSMGHIRVGVQEKCVGVSRSRWIKLEACRRPSPPPYHSTKRPQTRLFLLTSKCFFCLPQCNHIQPIIRVHCWCIFRRRTDGQNRRFYRRPYRRMIPLQSPSEIWPSEIRWKFLTDFRRIIFSDALEPTDGVR